VPTSIYRRFYRLPKDVIIRLDADYHKFDTARRFVAIGDRYGKFARTETVEISELNVKVHYLHDPNIGDKSGMRTSASSATSSTSTTCCLIHKNEMYSVMTQQAWSAAAPHFGIPFGSKELCVHIELADDDARPAGYRERLISKTAGKDIVPQDFAFCVRERMPDWVKDVIRNASPRPKDNYSDLERELQALLNKYKVRITGRKLSKVGEPSGEKKGRDFGRAGSQAGTGGGAGSHRTFHETPEGSTITALYEVYEKAPTITMLDTIEEVVEKGLKGRAALYISGTGQLFVNGLYEAVDRTVEDIEPEFVDQADDEAIRTSLVEAARTAMAYRVGKAVVYALAKKANEYWGEEDLATALAKESLSLAADDYLESLARVKRQVRDAIKLIRVAA
jgi:hypothetical protein